MAFPEELKVYWETYGKEDILNLISYENLGCKPGNPRFKEALKERLNTFDTDAIIVNSISFQSYCIHSNRGYTINFESNPRQKLVEAETTVFRSSDNGGIHPDLVRDVLSYFRVVHAQSFHLTQTALAAMTAVKYSTRREFDYKQKIIALRAIVFRRYKTCAVAFRIHVSLHHHRCGHCSEANTVLNRPC